MFKLEIEWHHTTPILKLHKPHTITILLSIYKARYPMNHFKLIQPCQQCCCHCNPGIHPSSCPLVQVFHVFSVFAQLVGCAFESSSKSSQAAKRGNPLDLLFFLFGCACCYRANFGFSFFLFLALIPNQLPSLSLCLFRTCTPHSL